MTAAGAPTPRPGGEPVHRKAPALYVVIGLFVLGLMGLNAWALASCLRGDVLAGAPEVMGRVTSLTARTGRYGSTRFATVSYEVVGADGTAQRYQREVIYSGVHLAEGQSVRVKYLADDPAVADLAVNAARENDSIMAGLIAIGVDIALLLVWARARRAERRQLEAGQGKA